MFSSSKKSMDSISYEKIQTIIGEGTEIKGNIQSTGVVRIDGVLEGTIQHNGDLLVGPKGKVVAEIRSKALSIAGEVRGEVHVEGKLELLPGSRLYGDIRCGHFVVHEGAMFHGRSIMAPDTEAEGGKVVKVAK